MISLHYDIELGALHGARPADLEARYGTYDAIRQIERASIHEFLEKHRQYLAGRVLDFGAGRSPYRDLVSGEYVAYEKGADLPSSLFDAILCTQVLQYLDDPGLTLRWGMYSMLKSGGVLVMTYPTNWDEVEESDLRRFTKAGMERLLGLLHFTIEVHERRAEVAIGHFKFPLGYGVIARR